MKKYRVYQTQTPWGTRYRIRYGRFFWRGGGFGIFFPDEYCTLEEAQYDCDEANKWHEYRKSRHVWKPVESTS